VFTPPPGSFGFGLVEIAQNSGFCFPHDAGGVIEKIRDRFRQLVRLALNGCRFEGPDHEGAIDHAALVVRTIVGATPRSFGREVEDTEPRDLTVVGPRREVPAVLTHDPTSNPTQSCLYVVDGESRIASRFVHGQFGCGIGSKTIIGDDLSAAH